MTPKVHTALLWLANLVVPGLGLVISGRLVWGVIIAISWDTALCSLLLAGFVWPGMACSQMTYVFAAGAAAVYAAAQIGLCAHVRAASNKASAARRDDLFKDAIRAYLQDRLDDGEAACKTLLRLDPQDVEAMLQLACVVARRGDVAQAKTLLRKVRYLDDQGKWDFHVERYLAALGSRAGGPDSILPRRPAH